jgi:hypothetical protein
MHGILRFDLVEPSDCSPWLISSGGKQKPRLSFWILARFGLEPAELVSGKNMDLAECAPFRQKAEDRVAASPKIF